MNEINQGNKSILMPSCDKLIVSSSPHIQTTASVSKIMLKVIIALVPAMAAGIYFFGIPAVKTLLFTAIFCVFAEALWCLIAGKAVRNTIRDGSAVVTGLILAMNFSPVTPWYVCLIGAFLAIWLGKQVFGGLGSNPFNPAVVARVALLIALPGLMTIWIPTRTMTETARHHITQNESYCKTFFSTAEWQALQDYTNSKNQSDVITCATPLSMVSSMPRKADLNSSNIFAAIDNRTAWKNYFLGNVSGSLGETSFLALLIGGVLLIIWKLINWRVPVFFIGTVFVFTGIINFFYPDLTPSPVFHIMTGGLMLGAIFMATDMVTSPVTNRGSVAFGIGCGLITSIIRIWGNYPEGISFAILFMNALVPFIDKMFIRLPFGTLKKKGA